MKLIIRAPNWIGDAVMSLPAIDAARDITGAEYISVMARPSTIPIYENHPNIDGVICINDKSSFLFGAKRSASLIKEKKYDVGIILTPSFSSALIFKLGKVRGRIGYASDKRSFLLTRAVQYPSENTHRMNSFLYLFEQISGKTITPQNPQLLLSHDDIQQGERILKEHGLSYDDPYIAIAPQAVAPSRRWGLDNYGKLSNRLISELKTKIILIGAKSDFEAGEKVKAFDNERIVNLCGFTGIRQAAAVASFAKLFIGNDSGLAHLAGAVNCPIVVLSGADNPKETSPVCQIKNIIIKDIECISCVKNKCPLKGEGFMQCMRLIEVDEVFNAAAQLYKS